MRAGVIAKIVGWVLVLGAHLGWAEDATIKLNPGETSKVPGCGMVQCAARMCKVEYAFVGKIYRVILADGKIYGEFKTRDEAIEAAKTLTSIKACDALDMKL